MLLRPKGLINICKNAIQDMQSRTGNKFIISNYNPTGATLSFFIHNLDKDSAC